MAVDRFPSIELADENGLLAVGGDLEMETLLLAYSSGIFPWPISEEYPLAWFSPHPRGLVEHQNLHCSRSLLKQIKKAKFSISLNQNFDQVIYHCAYVKNRKGQDGTWITPEIMAAYSQLFQAGHAYSVEVMQEDQLVGGLYGVTIESFFCGESMYFKESGASKLALLFWVNYLSQFGVNWLDTQMVTPIIGDLGGEEVSRRDFGHKLKIAINTPKSDFFKRTSFTHEEVLKIIQPGTET